MPQNSFRNIGLRRDKNFSDLENRETGLTNLLNDFPSGTDTYIGDDLNEAIKSIRSYPVTKIEINRLAGITFKNTVYNTITEESVTAPAVPLVTIKNQFDRVKLELGEESYFGGNVDSINANFYNSNQVLTNSTSTDSNSIFSGSPVLVKPFWLDGKFNFPNKFNSSLNDQQGGVQWNGYIVPEADEDIQFVFESSCNMLIEINGSKVVHLGNGIATVPVSFDGDKYTILANHVYLASNVLLDFPGQGYRRVTNLNFEGLNFTTDGPAPSLGTSTVTVYTRYVSWQVSQNGQTETRYYPIVDDVSYPEVSAIVPQDAFNINFNEPGVTVYQAPRIVSNFIEFEPSSFSASIWLPPLHASDKKIFNLFASMALSTIYNKNFYNFITTLPSSNPADFPEFKKFYENRLLQNGGKIGSALAPQSIITNKPIIATDYIPPDWNDVISQDTFNVRGSSNSRILKLGGEDDTLEDIGNISIANIDVGNIVIRGNEEHEIVKLLPGRGIILKTPTTSGQFVLRAVNHRGLVKIIQPSWSFLSTTVTINSTNDLIPGMILIYNGGKVEITKINSATSFEIASTVTNATAINDLAYIYQDAGVLNYTTYDVVTVTDTSTLILDTVLGIQPGYYIKTIGKAGTEHSQEIASVNDATNTITTVLPTTGDIAPGDKLIAERANINTAPPFVATLRGLSTDGANIKLTNSEGLVRALDIEVKSYISGTTEFTAASDLNYYRLIDITINDSETQTSVPYKIIATSFSNPEPTP